MGAIQCQGIRNPFSLGESVHIYNVVLCNRDTAILESRKAISQDYLLARPLSKSNGYGPHSDYYRASDNRHDVMPPYSQLTPSRSSYVTTGRSSSLRLPGSGHRKADYSYSTIGPESGFSSKASSSFDNANQSSSAPSTPETMIRRKPPPKPPRMRTSTDTLLRTPTMSMKSAGVHTLKSSIVDVTSALNYSLLPSFDRDETTNGDSPQLSLERSDVTSAAQDKVFSILEQTKEFLAFELEPDGILPYLVEKGVISRQDCADIRACLTEQARCELLIDVITSKGRREFLTFCDALRSVGCLGYLADFLEVLDTLVELATANVMRPIEKTATQSPNLRVRAFSFEGDRKCSACSCNNNNCEEQASFNDDASFDVDISYIHRDTEETRSVREVAAMKRRKRPLSITSEEFVLLDEADRYIPVISASLYNQCLKHQGINVIAGLLADYPCIRELSLVKNHMTAESMKILSKSLEKNRGLAKLDIRLNQIGDAGAVHLSRAISRHLSLRTLKLTSTGLSGLGCSHVIQGVAKSPRLTELDIGFNDMSEEACEALSKCLAANPALRRLRMRGNGITPYGARCIFKGLRRNCRVKYLDVSRNKIKDESLFVLCEVLLSNRTLSEINIENCTISAVGCSALARALKTNTSLRSLDLSMNNLEDQGATALGEGLKYNKALETLCLNMCSIGNVGFLRMLDALRHNTTISTLKLCYNNIGKRDEVDLGLDIPEIRPASVTEAHLETELVPNTSLILKSPRRSQSMIEKTNSVEVSDVERAHQRNLSASLNADSNIYMNSGDMSPININATRPSSLPLSSKSADATKHPILPVHYPPNPAYSLSIKSSPVCSPPGTSAPSTPSFDSVPQSFLASPVSYQSSSPIVSPATPGLSPSSPQLSPRSPIIATLRQSFTGRCTPAASSLDQVYETLCQVLQQNKDLKVLLWGNNFDDGQEDMILNEVNAVSNSTGAALQLRSVS
ncbi:hypothetical protein LSH36_119g02020 [Paralvinella palmiformis]|uniref:CARD domain-containing protein n=1 Tax=Paralvinella palmiformis TaxID=53620 RepID=A0AAD9N8Y8_9ANNE|nr:hypothetical protein LSH36_119g02020 [Paralvinella palmiformis]